MREGRGRGSSALSRSLGGTSRKVLLVLFVSFSASNSVLRLMRCYCFYPCYLSLSLFLCFSLARNVCVAFFMWTKTRRKLNKASEFAAIAQLLQLFHLFSAISSICVPSSPPPFLLFFLRFPLPATTYQSTRLVSVENYAIQKFALRVARLFVYFISRSSSLFFFSPPPPPPPFPSVLFTL